MAERTRTCSVEGCERPRKYRLYCNMHQARVRRTGTPGPPASMLLPAGGDCSVPGCDDPVRSKLLCAVHYDRKIRTGRVETTPHVDPGCAVEGCNRPHNALGYCNMHYLRVRKHGSPKADTPPKFATSLNPDDIVSRILERTERDGDCVVWVGYRMRSGYGTIRWRGRDWVVHRAMYTAIVGPIPEGDEWTIDHLCSNRPCVNVDHLELVTRAENSRRAGGLERANSANRSATQCRNGHEYTPENTGRQGSGRACLACRRARWDAQKDAINARRRAEYAERKHAKEEASE